MFIPIYRIYLSCIISYITRKTIYIFCTIMREKEGGGRSSINHFVLINGEFFHVVG